MLSNRLISGMNGYEIFRIPFSVVPICDSALHAPTAAGVFVHIRDNDMAFSSNLNTGKAQRKIDISWQRVYFASQIPLSGFN